MKILESSIIRVKVEIGGNYTNKYQTTIASFLNNKYIL